MICQLLVNIGPLSKCKNEKEWTETHWDMAFSPLAPSSIKTQKCAIYIKHQAVVYPGVSSTHKYNNFEIETKGNGGGLTEIWFTILINPPTHKTTTSHYIHETMGYCPHGHLFYTQIQCCWGRNENKQTETYWDMTFSLSATLLIKLQNHTVSIKHQAVVYPDVSSTHEYNDFEIEKKIIGWKLTGIWWKKCYTHAVWWTLSLVDHDQQTLWCGHMVMWWTCQNTHQGYGFHEGMKPVTLTPTFLIPLSKPWGSTLLLQITM